MSCTETTRNAAANRLYGKSFKDLSEAQKQLTLLQMVRDANRLSGAMGQAARESNGWENVLGNLKESWNQLLAAVGKPVLQGAVVVIQHITSAIQGLTKYAQMAADALSGLFGFAAADTAPAAAVADAAAAVDETLIRPEFKEAMDSYEAFFDEYIDFMNRYKANPTNAELLMQSADMLTKEATMLKEFDDWEKSGDMTTAETASARIGTIMPLLRVS